MGDFGWVLARIVAGASPPSTRLHQPSEPGQGQHAQCYVFHIRLKIITRPEKFSEKRRKLRNEQNKTPMKKPIANFQMKFDVLVFLHEIICIDTARL